MDRKALNQVGKAIFELDKASFSRPSTGPDAEAWQAARTKLVEILDRNGLEFSTPGSPRLKAKAKPKKTKKKSDDTGDDEGEPFGPNFGRNSSVRLPDPGPFGGPMAGARRY